MKIVEFTYYPTIAKYGRLEVPDDVEVDGEYIAEHFDDAYLLDYDDYCDDGDVFEITDIRDTDEED